MEQRMVPVSVMARIMAIYEARIRELYALTHRGDEGDIE